jgi:hypothetical protein
VSASTHEHGTAARATHGDDPRTTRTSQPRRDLLRCALRPSRRGCGVG